MALTELQLPTKENLYRGRQNLASRLDNMMIQLENEAEAMGFFTAADLTGLNVPSEVQADLVQYRTVIEELVSFYKGESTAQTNVPATVIDSIRSLV